jgi:hypothetical protein
MRRSLHYNYDGLHTTEISVISPSLPTSSIQNISKSQYQILSPLRQTLLWEQKQGTSYLGVGEIHTRFTYSDTAGCLHLV